MCEISDTETCQVEQTQRQMDLISYRTDMYIQRRQKRKHKERERYIGEIERDGHVEWKEHVRLNKKMDLISHRTDMYIQRQKNRHIEHRKNAYIVTQAEIEMFLTIEKKYDRTQAEQTQKQMDLIRHRIPHRNYIHTNTANIE